MHTSVCVVPAVCARFVPVPARARHPYSGFPAWNSVRGVALGRVQEADIVAGLDRGGHIRGAVIISRPDGNGVEYIAWLRPSWLRGFHLLYTFRQRDVRTYRNLNLLIGRLRNEWRYGGPITLRKHDDPKLSLSAFGDTPALPGSALGEDPAED